MSSDQANAATVRALGTRLADAERRITDLEATSAANEVKLKSYGNRLDALEKASEQAEHLALVAAANSDTQVKRVDYLQSILQVSNAANQIHLPPGVFNEGEEGLGDLGADGDEDGVGSLSQADGALERDPSLRKVILKALEELCDVPNFRELQYLVHPSVAEDHPDWPSAPGPGNQRVPLMRLDFTKSLSEAKNWKRIQEWADFVIDRGASITPEAADVLHLASRQVILAGCRYRFRYLKGEFQKKLKAAARESERGNSPPVGENLGSTHTIPPGMNLVPEGVIDPALQNQESAGSHEAGPGAYPETSINDLRSRAKSKCEMRIRQRQGLTGDHKTTYEDPKYDSFFTPGAQSDDETEYRLVDGAWVKTGKFVSRAPIFESVERRQCRDAVAAVKDPNDRARPVERKRGEPKPGAPRKAESLIWAVREWMVDSAVLAAHPEWVTNGIVIGNGTAWGDAAEPVLRNPRKRARRANNPVVGVAGPGPLTEQARNACRALEEAQKRARELQEATGEGNHDAMAVD